jgi:hypothetical protein
MENINFLCLLQTETASFRLFSANGNRKQKFVFLGWQTINGSHRLLFQRTSPSMYIQGGAVNRGVFFVDPPPSLLGAVSGMISKIR